MCSVVIKKSTEVTGLVFILQLLAWVSLPYLTPIPINLTNLNGDDPYGCRHIIDFLFLYKTIYYNVLWYMCFSCYRIYVMILCNWLIVWQNAFYLYLGRLRMCFKYFKKPRFKIKCWSLQVYSKNQEIGRASCRERVFLSV